MTKFPLYPTEQNPTVKLCVILPVKDEAEGLVFTLDALRNQLSTFGLSFDKDYYEVLLLTNNCSDNSFQLAQNYAATHLDFNLHVANIELVPEIAHIGTVRRLLMDTAYDRFLSRGKKNGIIASTDGDSEVDGYWVQNIILAIEKGIDAVGGRIIPKNTPIQSRLYHLQNVSYRYYVSQLDALLNPTMHDPWPRHFQCFGPSVAVTCDIYERAGRIPAIPFLEDEEFRKSLYRIDAKVRMSPDVKVYTSSRLMGKVEFGFSIQLQRWGEMKENGEQVFVNTLRSLKQIFESKYQLRQYWNASQFARQQLNLTKISINLMVPLGWLEQEVDRHSYFGQLWETVEKQMANEQLWNIEYPLAPIEDVIKDMRQFFNSSLHSSQSFNRLQIIS